MAKFIPLTHNQEIDLAKRIQEGDTIAREELIVKNVGLAYSIAHQYTRIANDYDELVQYGFLGLINAADLFEHARGFRFSTYASMVIHTEIQRGLSKLTKKYRKSKVEQELFKAYKTFIATNGRHPTASEMTKVLNSRNGKRYKLYSIEYHLRKIETSTVQFEELGVVGIAHSPEDEFCNNEEKENLREAINRLSAREQYIIARRFKDGATLRKIGAEIETVPERVWQIERKAIMKLEEMLM